VNKKIVIIGGGAAGMSAAIFAFRNGARDICIIEKGDSLGKKLSMTGNGRCNLSNMNMDGDMFNAAARDRVNAALAAFDVKDTLTFFRSLGVVIKSEDGYLYPVSGQARTIVDALSDEIFRNKEYIKVRFHEQLKEITPKDNGFVVRTDKGEMSCDSVILATGGLAGPKSTLSTGDAYYFCKKLGMNVKETFPALVYITSDLPELPKDNGVRIDAKIDFLIGSEVIASETGEVQFSKKGISGIPVMQASSEIARHLAEGRVVDAVFDFFPQMDDESYDKMVADMLSLEKNRTVGDFVKGLSNMSINDMILSRMKFNPEMKIKNISDSMLKSIIDNYRHFKIGIAAVGDYQAAQVTAGGISLGDLDENMQYKKIKGIYVIGELCDVNGRCGGYNLQWAWSSAYLAGMDAAK
jgi:predicted Rossmann fold flavoprotein